MLEITFWRESGANNSSSSHSIIFTKKKLLTDEDREFGWQPFTAACKTSKINYALISLYNTWRQHNDLGWKCTNISYDDLKRFYEEQFIKWLPLKLDPEYWRPIFDGYVDHQSLFTFPSYREVSKGINIEFAIDWIDELLKPEYVILGGNDNSESEHPFSGYSERITDLVRVYERLKERLVGDIAVKDELTGEWVISLKRGGIIKFKISN